MADVGLKNRPASDEIKNPYLKNEISNPYNVPMYGILNNNHP
jgi:hypothetical protein